MGLYIFKNIVVCVFFTLITISQTAKENKFHNFNVVELTNGFIENVRNFRHFKNNTSSLNSKIISDGLHINKIDFLHSLLMSVAKNDSNAKCAKDLLYWFKNIKSQDLQNNWALKMLDSFGKPGSGVLEGNVKWLGDFDECTKIYVPKEINSDAGDFNGKYCSAQIPLSIFSISLGMCLPDSCSPEEFSNLDAEPLTKSKLTADLNKFQSIAQSITCKVNSKPLTNGAIATMCVISIFLFLVFVGSFLTIFKYLHSTVYDDKDTLCENRNGGKVTAANADGDLDSHTYGENDDVVLIMEGSRTKMSVCIEKSESFFNCFCIFTNGAKLLNTDSTEGQLLCLHGIRFLSMAWVILCHCYGGTTASLRTVLNVLDQVDNLPFQTILNGYFSVDSFFVLSGFLMAFLYFQKASKNNGSIPWVYFYVHRYLRLTPVYMIVLAFFTTILPYISSGPFWSDYSIDPMCQKNWWWNLLYINNFKTSAEQCMPWAWYLGNDMQFFVISPLLLISLWRWPVIGYAVMGLFFAAYWTVSFVITYQYDLPPGIGNIRDATDPNFALKFNDYFDKYYTKPYTRIGPYLVGIVFAYIMFRRTLTRKRISLVVLCIGWIVSTAVGLLCVYGLYIKNHSVLASSLYNSLCRICYAASLCWVMFACLTEHGGVVDKILSYKLFVPLSRLTYSAYLIHPIILTYFFGSMRNTLVFSHMSVITMFLGILLVTYALSLLVSLVFESPIIRLEKLIRNKFQS